MKMFTAKLIKYHNLKNKSYTGKKFVNKNGNVQKEY